MRRHSLRAALAAVAILGAGATGAEAATEAYLGGLDSEPGARVKLRVATAKDEEMTVRSFTVKDFSLGCERSSTLVLRRAKLSGEIPVGRSGRFRIRDDNGETVFSLRGSIGAVNKKAKGQFRYSGDFVTEDGGRAECDSDRLRWRARR